MLQMTDSMVGVDRFMHGGTDATWPYGGDDIIYRVHGAVFLPAVVEPAPTSPKTLPTMLSPTKVRVYSTRAPSATLVWTLPLSWKGKVITSTALTPTGPVVGPSVAVSGRNLTMLDVPAFTPVILTINN